MNYMLVPVLAIGAGTFVLGWRFASRPRSRQALAAAIGLGGVAVLYAAYYLHFFDTGDPLIGREETPLDALRRRYHFTGFFAVIVSPSPVLPAR